MQLPARQAAELELAAARAAVATFSRFPHLDPAILQRARAEIAKLEAKWTKIFSDPGHWTRLYRL